MIKYQTIWLLLCLSAATGTQAQQVPAAKDPATVIISPEMPLSVKDTTFRKQILQWSTQQMDEQNYKKIKAQPSSVYFPGKVKDGAVLISRAVHISHQQIRSTLEPIVSKLDYSSPWADNLYSTALYAEPGEFIEVTIPRDLVGKGVGVQIGIHSDNLGEWVAGTEDWRRMPMIVKQVVLKKETTRISSPFGGLIYITASPKSATWEADITLNRVVAAPYFQAGKTSRAEWLQQLQDNKAPWGELATEHVILTLPDSVLQKVQYPDSVMKIWDLIIGGEMELAQIPMPFYRPQRMVIDEQIGGGFMHSGYPIMIHHSPSRHLLSADVMADPKKLLIPSRGGANWGFFHEIGHNMQNMDWVFDGTTEVSNNLFSLYMFDRLTGGLDDAHSAISSANTQKDIRKYFAGGADYEKWKKDPFLGLILFRQLQEGFGWESFKTFFRQLHEMAILDPSGAYADTDQKKRDLWALKLSRITGRNLAPFFEKWGVVISQGVKDQLAPLPGWMPYNFPPAD